MNELRISILASLLLFQLTLIGQYEISTVSAIAGTATGRIHIVADDPIYEQDGVAPQCAIGGIGTRRAYIPPQDEVEFKKNFLNSHSEGNYGWIFTRENKQRGHVKPK